MVFPANEALDSANIAGRAESARHNQSILLSLPAELRNRIYRLVLVKKAGAFEADKNHECRICTNPRKRCLIDITIFGDDEFNDDIVKVWDGHKVLLKEQPSMLQVNQQIRAEAIRIYYQENKFQFAIADFEAGVYLRWCRSSLERRRCNLWMTPRCDRSQWLASHSQAIKQWLQAYCADQCEGLRYDNKEGFEYGRRFCEGDLGGSGLKLFAIVDRMKHQQNLEWAPIQNHVEDILPILKVFYGG